MPVLPRPASRPAVVLAALLLGLVAAPVAAQGRAARLTARIVDSAGAPVPGARIRVPQLERAWLADSTGFAIIDSLPVGRLVVVAEAPGRHGVRRELTLTTGAVQDATFTLAPNANVLATVEVRARSRTQLPLRLQEYALRRDRGLGRFMDPEQFTRASGMQLSDALKPILAGARFRRNGDGFLSLVSARTINVPQSMTGSANVKPCGVQIWQDGVLVSDPNSSADIVLEPSATSRRVETAHLGADKEVDVFSLLADNFMAAEYYPDVASTPPGFRSATTSCGVLVLWTRSTVQRIEP